MKLIIGFFAVIVLFSTACSVPDGNCQETINLVTYYPVPFGAYDRLRLVPRNNLNEPCDIGLLYVNNNGELQFCKDNGSGVGTWSGSGGGVWTQDDVNDYIYPADTVARPDLFVGIGTETPQAPLHIDTSNNSAVPGILLNASTVLGDEGDPRGSLHIASDRPYITFQDSGAADPNDVWRIGGWNDDFTFAFEDDSANDDTDVLFLQRNTGNVGILCWNPDKRLEVNLGTDSALRLTYNDGNGSATEYADFAVNSSGNLSISPSGQQVGIGTVDTYNTLDVEGNLAIGGATFRDDIAPNYGIIVEGKLGIGTSAPRKLFHVQNPAQPTYYMLYDEGKSALRLGHVTGTEWDDANIGLYSSAFGETVLASGLASIAFGQNVTASGFANFAVGNNIQTSNIVGVALGQNLTASGNPSVAIGLNLNAAGLGSLVLGSGMNTAGLAVNSVGIGLGAGGATLNQPKTLSIMGGTVGINTVTPNVLFYKLDVNGNTNISGNLSVSGTVTKGSGSFVQPHPTDPTKEINYAFFEGRENNIFFQGVAELKNGEARINVPEDFQWVASKEIPYNVIVTPFGKAALYVKERLPNQFTVAVMDDSLSEAGNMEFGYMVIAVRGGFERSMPVQKNQHFFPEKNTDKKEFEAKFIPSEQDSYYSRLNKELNRRLLIQNGILKKDGTLNKKLIRDLEKGEQEEK